MSYTQEELQNISKLLLSVEAANVDLAFVLMEQEGAVKSLITELFAVYKLGTSDQSSKAKTLLMSCVDESPGLLHVLKQRSHLDGASPRKKIKKFAADCADIDPVKLAMALYNRYGEGLQYLVSELPEEAVKELLRKYLQGTTFELTDDKITKIPPHIFKDYTEIEILNLSNNHIRNIPGGIGELKNLKVFHFSNNRLSKLHKAIGKLSQLEELYLNNNNIKELPVELNQLTKLRKLELEYLCESPFPVAITELPALEELSLSYQIFSKVEIDEAFFNFKTDRLIRLDFGGQERWSNLPVFSEVTGTYDDPIDTQPLALARRAYAQNKESLPFLLEHAPAEEAHVLIREHMPQADTLRFEHIDLRRLPQVLKEYDIKVFQGEKLHLVGENIWKDLLYLPQLEVLDWGMDTDTDTYSWQMDCCPITILQQLPKLRVLNLGRIRPYDELSDLIKLSQLEELWLYCPTLMASLDKLEPLDELTFLKEMPHLRKFCLKGIYYYHEPEKVTIAAVEQAVVAYIRSWLPEGCEIIIDTSDIF